MSGDMVPAQNGHMCKPTALAAMDAYFAQDYGIPNIPLRKGMTSQIDSTSGKLPKSVRELAKSVGSAQGEILQADMLLSMAAKMGYQATSYKPTDIDDFRSAVMDSIASRNPVVTCFAVNRKTGFPSRGFDGGNEHAALIVGYNGKQDTVDIAHWSELYKRVPVKKLYESMLAIPETREQEIYERTGTSVSSPTWKYSPADDGIESSDNELRCSIVPEHGSGFKNTLFFMSPDLGHDRWHSASDHPED